MVVLSDVALFTVPKSDIFDLTAIYEFGGDIRIWRPSQRGDIWIWQWCAYMTKRYFWSDGHNRIWRQYWDLTAITARRYLNLKVMCISDKAIFLIWRRYSNLGATFESDGHHSTAIFGSGGDVYIRRWLLTAIFESGSDIRIWRSSHSATILNLAAICISE